MNPFQVAREVAMRAAVRAVRRPWFGLASVLLIAACAEPTTRRTQAPATDVQATVAVSDGMSLQCPPGPGDVAKQVDPGTGLDANGNGVICVERTALPDMPALDVLPPDAPPPVESDDSLFPIDPSATQ